MDELDRRILAFVGAHRFVLDAQISHFLEAEKARFLGRLESLEAHHFVRSERASPSSRVLRRITGSGLRAIASRMPAPEISLIGVRHELAVVWSWVAAWQGGLGETERVLSRREMCALDDAARSAGRTDRPFAVRMP